MSIQLLCLDIVIFYNGDGRGAAAGDPDVSRHVWVRALRRGRASDPGLLRRSPGSVLNFVRKKQETKRKHRETEIKKNEI